MEKKVSDVMALFSELLAVRGKVWYNEPNLPAWAMDRTQVLRLVEEKQREIMEKIKAIAS